MVLVTAVGFAWDILQLDAQTECIHAKVEEEVYVKMAPGCEKKDEKTGVLLAMRLRKSSYGLRQSPINWHSTIDTYVMKIGNCSSLTSAPTSTTRTTTPLMTTWRTRARSRRPSHSLRRRSMLAGGEKAVLQMLKEKLMSRFATTDVADISHILGIHVTCNRGSGTLTMP